MKRTLTIPAAEVREGDVLVHNKNGREGERDIVQERYLDGSDGEVYIKTTGWSEYMAPYKQVVLDVVMTLERSGVYVPKGN